LFTRWNTRTRKCYCSSYQGNLKLLEPVWMISCWKMWSIMKKLIDKIVKIVLIFKVSLSLLMLKTIMGNIAMIWSCWLNRGWVKSETLICSEQSSMEIRKKWTISILLRSRWNIVMMKNDIYSIIYNRLKVNDNINR